MASRRTITKRPATATQKTATKKSAKPQPAAPSAPALEQESCAICHLPLDPENVSTCRMCGQKFHMQWDSRAEVPPCGGAVMDQVACGLVFLCANCGGAPQG